MQNNRFYVWGIENIKYRLLYVSVGGKRIRGVLQNYYGEICFTEKYGRFFLKLVKIKIDWYDVNRRCCRNITIETEIIGFNLSARFPEKHKIFFKEMKNGKT